MAGAAGAWCATSDVRVMQACSFLARSGAGPRGRSALSPAGQLLCWHAGEEAPLPPGTALPAGLSQLLAQPAIAALARPCVAEAQRRGQARGLALAPLEWRGQQPARECSQLMPKAAHAPASFTAAGGALGAMQGGCKKAERAPVALLGEARMAQVGLHSPAEQPSWRHFLGLALSRSLHKKQG